MTPLCLIYFLALVKFFLDHPSRVSITEPALSLVPPSHSSSVRVLFGQTIPLEPESQSFGPEALMSSGLPFPVSDNRSFPSQDVGRFQEDLVYGHDHDPTQYRGAALKLPGYRPYDVHPSRGDMPPHEGMSYTDFYDHNTEYPTRFHSVATYDNTGGEY